MHLLGSINVWKLYKSQKLVMGLFMISLSVFQLMLNLFYTPR